jgi:hypothetical protein
MPAAGKVSLTRQTLLFHFNIEENHQNCHIGKKLTHSYMQFTFTISHASSHSG